MAVSATLTGRHRSGLPPRLVIVIGLQMPLPIVKTTPSVQHRDLYTTCNRRMDDLAFDLTRWLNRQGHAAIPLSCDGYANIHMLIRKSAAAFAHIFSAYYAGIGHIGVNNTILTRSFGPRVRFVSVFTDARLPTETDRDALSLGDLRQALAETG